MTEHRESPEIEPEEANKASSTSSRRFERLVGSPAARRVALPRLVAVVAGLMGSIWLVIFGLRSTIGWVDSRPEHQLAFAKIELDPPPDPWLVGGRSLILEQVRSGAKLPEMLPLLELDLDLLRNDFLHCPWIKGVDRIERSYRRLTVRLVYRKPVAVVVLEKPGVPGYVIDEEGVPLPKDDIDWKSQEPPFQVRGIADPLIEIRGVSSEADPKFGVPWKRPDSAGSPDDRDLMVLGAARLAEFLQGKPKTTPSGRKVPDFVAIRLPDEPTEILFLRDSDSNWVRWGESPGSERSGEPSAEEKWKMLLGWVDRHGPIGAKSPNFLRFTRTEAELVRGIAPRKKPIGSH